MLEVNGKIENLIPYKPGKTIEEIKRKYNIDEIIKLGSNENAFGTSPNVILALKEFCLKTSIYPDGACYELKKRLSNYLNVSFDNLVIGNGSNEIIELIYRAFILDNDSIITCCPTFSFYKICSMTTSGNFIEVPLKNYTFNLNGLLEKIDEKTKLIIICNPNNPTGTIVSQEELRKFIRKVSNDVLIAIDEAYIDFVEEDNELDGVSLINEFPEKNIIILRTFSKLYGLSALRIGYAVAKKEISEILNKVRQPFNVNGFAQTAAIAAIEDNDFFKITLQKIIEGKHFIYNELDKLGIFYLKSNGNFIFFKLPYDNDFIFEKFLKKGIIIRSLKSFGYEHELRVTIGTMEQNKKFIKALKEILNEI